MAPGAWSGSSTWLTISSAGMSMNAVGVTPPMIPLTRIPIAATEIPIPVAAFISEELAASHTAIHELLDPRDHHRVVVEWNATQTPFPGDRCLHDLFRDQARR